MIGAMAGVGLAVGLHAIFSTWPALAAGWPGAVMAWIARPGVLLVGAVARQPFHQELGIVAAWLSLQLTLVVGGALLGAVVGVLCTPRAPPGAPHTEPG
jgi:hypothetical protein